MVNKPWKGAMACEWTDPYEIHRISSLVLKCLFQLFGVYRFDTLARCNAPTTAC